MNLIKPNKINIGDTIAIIAPSGEVDKNKIELSAKYFENKGYKVKLGKNIYKRERYLAGRDDERLEDLHENFSDTAVKAIICARGGYGAIRLIDKIDYDLIKSNPKIFCGYSDITALSSMILKKSNLITFSAPMAQSDFSDDINSFTETHFWDSIQNNKITINPENLSIYKKGNAEGILFGGNLSTITSLCGQNFIPEDKFIFFAEDLCEPVYKIDRYFRQLLNIKEFRDKLSAIILGEFSDVDNTQWLNDLFIGLSKELDIPILGGYKITHAKEKITIPIGGKAKLQDGIITVDY